MRSDKVMGSLVLDIEYQKELESAFCDIMDGQTASDIKYLTGLPEGRCQEIYDFYTNKVLTKIGK